jgi:hypothetical protein
MTRATRTWGTAAAVVILFAILAAAQSVYTWRHFAGSDVEHQLATTHSGMVGKWAWRGRASGDSPEIAVEIDMAGHIRHDRLDGTRGGGFIYRLDGDGVAVLYDGLPIPRTLRLTEPPRETAPGSGTWVMSIEGAALERAR